MIENIAWIFFDMGGVLLDDTKVESMRQCLLLEIGREFLPNLQMQDVLRAWLEASKIPGSVRINALRYIFQNHLELKTAEEKYKEMCDFDYHKSSRIRPEAKEVLLTLSHTYQLGLMANQSTKSLDSLTVAGLSEILNHAQLSADIGLEKPDPNFYKSILRECQTTAKEAILVDDNWYRGLKQAKSLGMKTVLFKRDIIPAPPDATPDWTISKLQDLLTIFSN